MMNTITQSLRHFVFLITALAMSVPTMMAEPGYISKIVHVTVPDQLRTLLTEQDKKQVTHLTITGTIDARDFKIMRDSLPRLSELDLSGVSINEYKGFEGTYTHKGSDWFVGDHDGYCEYAANAIPQEAFAQLFNNSLSKYLVGRKSLRRVVLPSGMESIEEKAFYDCTELEYFEIYPSVSGKFITVDGVVYSKDKDRLVIFPPGKVGAYEFPSSLKVIEAAALDKCTFSLLTFNTAVEPQILSTNFKAVLVKVPEGCISNYVSISNFKVIDKLNVVTVKTSAQKNVADAILETGIHPSLIHKLIVSGELNDEDILIIRNMSSLYWLDLSGTSLLNVPDNAFGSNEQLCTIVLPKMVESIGRSAFGNCSNLMGELVLPNTLRTIGSWAFYRTKINKVVFPSGLNDLGSESFSATHLRSVDLSGCNQLDKIRKNTFKECSKLSSVQLPASLISIEESAFESANIVAIDFPGQIQSIGVQAFSGCPISALRFPASLLKIDNDAFNPNMQLSSVDFSACKSLTRLGNYVFSAKPLLKEVDLSACNNLKSIGYGCFESYIPRFVTSPPSYPVYSGLERIILPGSLEELDGQAFYSCYELKSIDLSNTKLRVLEEGLFEDCQKLESVMLPMNLNLIQSRTFANCTSLKTLVCPILTPPTLEDDVFVSVEMDNVNLRIPNKTMGAYAFSPGWSGFIHTTEAGYLVNAVIDSNEQADMMCGVVRGNGLFQEGISAELSIDNISENLICGWFDNQGAMLCTGKECAFKVSGHTELILRMVGRLVSYDFDSVTGTLSIVGGAKSDTVTQVGVHAALSRTNNSCKDIKYVDFTRASGIVAIGNGAFEGCDNLISISLPQEVAMIGDSAFWGCANLAVINCISFVEPTIGIRAFEVGPAIRTLNVPNAKSGFGTGADNKWGATKVVYGLIPPPVVNERTASRAKVTWSLIPEAKSYLLYLYSDVSKKWLIEVYEFDEQGVALARSTMAEVVFNLQELTGSNMYYVEVEAKDEMGDVMAMQYVTIPAFEPVLAYSVVFNTLGGSLIPADRVESGKYVIAPDLPTLEGYTFEGWYRDATWTNKWNFDTDMVFYDIILYAKWSMRTGIEGVDVAGVRVFSLKNRIVIEGLEPSERFSVITASGNYVYPETVASDSGVTISVPVGIYMVRAGKNVVKVVVK